MKQRNVVEALVILIDCLQSVWARRALLPVYFCSICWVACRITACQNLSHPTRSLPSSCCYQSRLCALLLQCSPALTRLLSQPLWRTLSFHLISRHRCRVSFILVIHKKIFEIIIAYNTLFLGLFSSLPIKEGGAYESYHHYTTPTWHVA